MQRRFYLGVALVVTAVPLLIGVLSWIRLMQLEQKTASSAQDPGTSPVRAIAVQYAADEAAGSRNAATDDARTKDEATEQAMKELRHRMVEQQLRGRDITDARVLEAMEEVPRHLFVPEPQRENAYADHPLPIGNGQTISQPYIVALMTQLAEPEPTERALDVGTGSGYQAAILSRLVKDVYSIEIVESLADSARQRLNSLGYRNIEARCGDGYRGWPEHAPFDIVIVAAAPDHIPQALVDQLASGGRLVIPVGKFFQNLIVVTKRADGSVEQETIAPVAFVPMTGEAQNSGKSTHFPSD